MEAATSVDAVRGTITGSTRYIGLGGAFVAIADDTQGVAMNPASVAVRLPYSWSKFAYAFGIDFAVGSWLPKNDIYNEPASTGTRKTGSLFGSLALLINYEHAGFGVAAEAEHNAVTRENQEQGVSKNLAANFGVVHTNTAYGFLDGQLLLGAGLRFIGLSFDRSQSAAPLTAGIGYEAGTILKPKGRQFRLGVSFKSPINAKLEGDATTAPVSMHVPWALSFGVACQFGRRPLNPTFVTVSERVRRNTAGREPTSDDTKKAEQELFEEYQKAQTWYLLVSTEFALIEGAGHLGLSGTVANSQPLISPRLGVESEVIPRHLRLRLGSYLELPRTEDGLARLHGTGGVDIKLFEWSVFGLVKPFDYWQLSLAADGARSYFNTSFSVGFWH